MLLIRHMSQKKQPVFDKKQKKSTLFPHYSFVYSITSVTHFTQTYVYLMHRDRMDALNCQPMHHPYAHNLTQMCWNVPVWVAMLVSFTTAWFIGCVSVFDSQFCHVCVCVRACKCACVCVCVCACSSHNSSLSMASNGWDPVKLFCDPLGFQQWSMHAQVWPLKPQFVINTGHYFFS